MEGSYIILIAQFTTTVILYQLLECNEIFFFKVVSYTVCGGQFT